MKNTIIPNFKAILACNQQGVIGCHQHNKYFIPWNIPSDLQHFFHTTKNSTLILGYKTYKSLPSTYVKLKSQNNQLIVLSAQHADNLNSSNINYVTNLKKLSLKINELSENNNNEDIYLCGGKTLYEYYIPQVSQWIVSEIITNNFDLKEQNYIIIKNVIDILKNKKLYTKHTIYNNKNSEEQFEYQINIYTPLKIGK